MSAPTKKKSGGGIDIGTFVGLVVAFGAILGGLLMEGGRIADITQLTAALIVLGGTLGAVMIATPPRVLKGALKRLAGVVKDPAPPIAELLEELIEYATQARKLGLVSLEDSTAAVSDPFLKKGLMLAVDGSDLQEIRSLLEMETDLEEARAEAEAKVFEGAGGYAPTIGIIGAVLGLIQVMKNLANIDEVGHGIAVAFVATVYGVGLSNLVLLPVAQKIKARAHAEAKRRELIMEGIAGIVEGLNPKLLRLKLEAFSPAATAPKAGAKAKLATAAVAEEA
ncbi:MAG: flagellar motor protein [Acidobacteriota bacterium]